jgi:hypothetical protein
VIPLRARRLVAGLLSVAGLAALLLAAAVPDLPPADSIGMALRFWRAGPRGRLLNAPGIARDAGFAADVLRAAAAWPAGEDVVLSAGPEVPPELRERLRRKAAYLLAPRRVRVELAGAPGLRLTRVPPGAAR